MADTSSGPDLTPVLETRLRRTDGRRAVIAAVFVGCAALVITLYVVRPGTGPSGPPLRITVLSSILVAAFLAGGAYQGCLVAAGARRREHLLSVLSDDPRQVERIYAAVSIRVGRSAVVQPIKGPEGQHLSRRTGYQVVVRLREPGRLRRLLNLSTYLIAVPRAEVLPLLDFLRSRAPDALGPP